MSKCDTPLFPYCIQEKQSSASMLKSATRGFIILDNPRPRDKVSCNHYASREPGFIENLHSCVLKKEYANFGTIIVDNASDLVFHFVQTSTEGMQTFEGKHKFERFAKN